MKKAMSPAEITPLLLDILKSGNLDDLSSVYEANAVMIIGENHQLATGVEEIKGFFAGMLKNSPVIEAGSIKAPVVNGNIAMTSSILPDGRTTAEIARQQPDGSWKWCLDNPMVAGEKQLKAQH